MVAGWEGVVMPAVTVPEVNKSSMTASSFLPQRKPPARAWQRIPVPASNRPYKIWKRVVGELGSETVLQQYALALEELDSQGQGHRKRARTTAYVPVWGEARWDTRAEEIVDGKWDLVEARATVAAIQDEQIETERHAIPQRVATFPEDKMRWVPRKRHNSRWPIEPVTQPVTTMVADLQPLVEYDMPTEIMDTAAAQHSPQRADEKHMRRRSTRRLSRRVSFAPVGDVPVLSSPVTRGSSLAGATPAQASPNNVTGSPRRSFTLHSTPSKVLFRPSLSPSKSRSPAVWKSPVKVTQPLCPPIPIIEVSEAEEASSLLSESSVLVFDQPVPEVQTEPAHEARRRVSLQNARRLDRKPLGDRRYLDFGVAQPAPNRRHSFMLQKAGPGTIQDKSRRHTLDVFGGKCFLVSESEQDEESTTGLSSVETTENISEVVVDVGANLDIFGENSGVTRRRKGRRASSQPETLPEGVHSQEQDSLSSPQSATQLQFNNAYDSTLGIGLGVTHEGEVEGGAVHSPSQAAMLDSAFGLPTDDKDEAPSQDQDLWDGHSNNEVPTEQPSGCIADNDLYENDMFAPHDPEGLSTIFEESSLLEQSPPPQRADDFGEEVADALVYSPVNTIHGVAPAVKAIESQDGASPSPTPPPGLDEHAEPSVVADINSTQLLNMHEDQPDPVCPREVDEDIDRPTTDDEVLVQPTPRVETDDVLSALEQLEERTTDQADLSPSSPASPREDEPRLEPDQQQPRYDVSTPDDDDSIATPEDDYCCTIVVDGSPADEDAASAQNELGTLAKQQQHDDVLAQSCVVEPESVPRPVSGPDAVSSPAADVLEAVTLAGTPPRSTADEDGAVRTGMEDAETVLETPPGNSKGFIPINSHRVSPSVSQSPDPEDLGGEDEDDLEDIQDEDMVLAMDYEPTVPIQLDSETATATMVEASEPDTAAPAALQEDSETEMLRKFVTRVSANKNAKAAAASLARRNLRPQRRSGSTGSTTSVTGSPGAKSSSSLPSESAPRMLSSASASSPPRSRFPLGEKDANSPSPTKKRKASAGAGGKRSHADDLFKGNPALFSAEISPPKSKRLRGRKRTIDTEPDSSLLSHNGNQSSEQQQPLSGDMAICADLGVVPTPAGAGAPRRSTRRSNSRVQLKPPAPSANSIALSLIPVRLPGSSSMIVNAADTSADKDMPAPVVVPRATRTTAEEKDLAAVTRVNTRKNKGGALPPKLVLSRQAEDPAGFRLKELKGVFDAREGREVSVEEAEGEGGPGNQKDGRKSRKGKSVSWASELVRFNTDVEVQPTALVALPPPSRKGAKAQPAVEEKVDDYVPPFPAAVLDEGSVAQSQPVASSTAVEEVAEEQRPPLPLENAAPPAPTRRTRASRLQMPTPVSKKILAGGEPSPAAAAKVTSSSASVVKMATRRTKIASLGMGVNGTPAPKRRSRA